MRIRVLGQHVPAPLAVLALIEVGLAFLALYAAVLLRFQTRLSHLSNLERELGRLWPRGLVFSAIVAVCLLDRKSTRLNSSHSQISYAVFCLKKKKQSVRRPPPCYRAL